MALVVKDRIQETGTAPNTSTFNLSGPVAGFQGFSAIGAANNTYYGATDVSGNWEVGYGMYLNGPDTIARMTVLESSNSGSAVTFSGTVTIFCTYPAERSVFLDSTDTNSFTDGQLLIGDSSTGTLNKTTLTAGTNITITNGNGSIEIAASGGGGSSFPFVNPATISQDITVTTGNNAMLVGPVTVANGYSITVEDGANFVVIT